VTTTGKERRVEVKMAASQSPQEQGPQGRAVKPYGEGMPYGAPGPMRAPYGGPRDGMLEGPAM